MNLVIVYWLQVTTTWFSKDDVIKMHSILVNAILQMLCMSNFTNTCWVADLGDVTNGGGSTSTQSISVSALRRSDRTRKLVFYAN